MMTDRSGNPYDFLPPGLFEADIVEETKNIASVQRMDGESHTDLLKVLPEVLKSGVADWLFKSKVNRDVKDKSS